MNPIEAKVRKGKGAVGAYGNERTQQSLQDFPVVDSEEEEEKVNYWNRCRHSHFSHLYPLLLLLFITCRASLTLFVFVLKEFKKELGQWRKDPAGTVGKKKPKYSYKTADELKAKGKMAYRGTPASAGELAQVKVCQCLRLDSFIYVHMDYTTVLGELGYCV